MCIDGTIDLFTETIDNVQRLSKMMNRKWRIAAIIVTQYASMCLLELIIVRLHFDCVQMAAMTKHRNCMFVSVKLYMAAAVLFFASIRMND